MRLQRNISKYPNQILPTFMNTITILNKLDARQSSNNVDVWYKTVLYNTAFTSSTVRTVTGTTVSIGNVFTSRVPKDNRYKPYNEWSTDPTLGFTFSVGDKIIKGEIEECIITSQTINEIMQKYQHNAFTIKVFRDNSRAIQLAEHYYLEGV